ncbi:MAG: hypothetical protein KA157_02710 [Aliarcobacter sp.]|nr:hypothetical protein [Aliarcobacter sp.]
MNTTLKYYKDLIKKHFLLFFIVFVAVFSLSLIYAYFAQRIYQSDATVEIIKYKQDVAAQKDSFQIAVKENSPKDESEILKSNFLIDKAINKMSFEYEYFNKHSGKFFAIDKEEFPFTIGVLQFKNKDLYNERINITPIDDEYYEISFDTSTLMSKLKGSSNILKLQEKYKYNVVVENEFFILEVNKKEGI